MKLKKIVSVVLATVMALALAVPAFASGGIGDARLAVSKATEYEVEMEGEVYTPVLRLQVSTKGAKVYVNPSKGDISGEITGFSEGSTPVPIGYKFTGKGVASTPIIIRSDSDTGLTVNATVTLTMPKTVTIASAAPTKETTTKQVYVQVAGTDPDKVKEKGTVAALDDDSFSAISDSKGGVIKEAGKAQSVQAVTTVAAALQSDGTTVKPQYAGVMLTGSCTPSSSTIQWTEDDAVSATIVLTFTGVSST